MSEIIINPYTFASPPITYIQATQSSSVVYIEGVANKKIAGEKCVNSSSLLFGKKITNIQFRGQRQNDIGGNLSAKHYASDNSVKYTYWTIVAQTLPTGESWVDPGTGSSDVAFATGDYFGFEYDDTDLYVVSYKGTPASRFDGTNSIYIEVNEAGSVTTDTTQDMCFTITVV
tara:strand:- start:74 stop:592 length:519 start_codon:yes stop_codon:yes gene_type:complete